MTQMKRESHSQPSNNLKQCYLL